MSDEQNDAILESIWEDIEQIYPNWTDEEKAIETNKVFNKMCEQV